MKTIWKFTLALTDRQVVKIPSTSTILTVQMQRNDICMWVLVDSDAPLVEREFTIVGTGNPAPDLIMEYIGTFQTGAFVWHLFDSTH